jgi:NAD(P)-dependent dehydrogenase (short-subunit alcohol dehydrogenase family)
LRQEHPIESEPSSHLQLWWLSHRIRFARLVTPAWVRFFESPWIGGLIGLPGRAIYHAAKHGVLGLTKSAAIEYAAKGIRINAVCPGTIETPMVEAMLKNEPEAMQEILKQQPIGRLGKPEEIAAAVLWLCSPASSFVIGHALVVDGGFTIH